MNLGRCAGGAVDRDHVLWASGHDHDAIEDRTQCHVIPGLAERLSPRDLAVRADRNVHPEVQGGRTLRDPQIKLPQRNPQVIGAVVMILRAAQRGVAMYVAGRDDRVMTAG